MADFSTVEFINAIKNCSSLSIPDPDHILWCYLKILVTDNNYITNFVNITNACIDLSFWPSHFKNSTSIIIPKPNKSIYDFPKAFYSIVFLNIFRKLIEKVINKRIQIHSIANNFIHPNQLGGLKQCFMVNTWSMLWLKDLRISQEKPCIGFIQENSIKDSVQDCLPYILKPHGSCYYFSLF